MNAIVWTLWLVTFAPGGGGAPAVTPLATYPTDAECYASINQIWSGMRTLYGKDTGGPGSMFCVRGAPIRK